MSITDHIYCILNTSEIRLQHTSVYYNSSAPSNKPVLQCPGVLSLVLAILIVAFKLKYLLG